MKNNNQNKDKGKMTVEEAGRKGGERTSETHGREFYSDIGQKGGQKVKKLVEEGKVSEENEEEEEIM